MGVGDWFGGLVSLVRNSAGLWSQEQVAQLLPDGSQYATIGSSFVVEPGRLTSSGAVSLGPDGVGLAGRGAVQRRTGLLALTSHDLHAVWGPADHWGCSASEVTELQALPESGFVVVTRTAGGLVVGNQTPARVPVGSGCRTLSGVTNAFAGWDEVLGEHGTRRRWG